MKFYIISPMMRIIHLWLLAATNAMLNKCCFVFRSLYPQQIQYAVPIKRIQTSFVLVKVSKWAKMTTMHKWNGRENCEA